MRIPSARTPSRPRSVTVSLTALPSMSFIPIRSIHPSALIRCGWPFAPSHQSWPHRNGAARFWFAGVVVEVLKNIHVLALLCHFPAGMRWGRRRVTRLDCRTHFRRNIGSRWFFYRARRNRGLSNSGIDLYRRDVETPVLSDLLTFAKFNDMFFFQLRRIRRRFAKTMCGGTEEDRDH